MSNRSPVDSFFDGMDSALNVLEANKRLQEPLDKSDIQDADFVDKPDMKMLSGSVNVEDAIAHLRVSIYTLYGKVRKDKKLSQEFKDLISEVNDLVNG